MLGRTIRTLLEVRQETKAHFLVGTVILGFLSIFKNSQASSPFEALNSMCLSRYQSDVIPPVQIGRRTMAFSRFSTGDTGGLSVLPSSKSRFLTCLIGNKELLCTQCRGIIPHLSASGKSDVFSRVAAGSWGMFSSYGGGSH